MGLVPEYSTTLEADVTLPGICWYPAKGTENREFKVAPRITKFVAIRP